MKRFMEEAEIVECVEEKEKARERKNEEMAKRTKKKNKKEAKKSGSSNNGSNDEVTEGSKSCCPFFAKCTAVIQHMAQKIVDSQSIKGNQCKSMRWKKINLI